MQEVRLILFGNPNAIEMQQKLKQQELTATGGEKLRNYEKMAMIRDKRGK